MARLVKRIVAACVVVLPLGAAAMGPHAPFTPPAPRAAASSASGTAAAESAAGLRGVRLGSAPAALIDGTWITPGQPVRGARLATVRIDGALLRHPGGRTERLALFPTPAATSTADERSASTSTDSVQGPP